MAIEKERNFVCPECGETELRLVRRETTSRVIYQSGIGTPNGWDHGKEEILDCEGADTMCACGHVLTLKDGTTVQDDLEALEQWFEEQEESTE